MKYTIRGDENQEVLLPVGEVIDLVIRVRDRYAPEVLPETSAVADDICGEIIGNIKESAGIVATTEEGGRS